MKSILLNGRVLATVVILHVTLAIGWAVLVPPFEHPDEAAHFAYVQFVATHWRQPVQSAESEPYVEQETQQPPLYYFIDALPYAFFVKMGLPKSDLSRLQRNRAYYGFDDQSSAKRNSDQGGAEEAAPLDPFDRNANRVYYAHDQSTWITESRFPWDVLATRLLSLLYSVPLVLAALACGALLWPAEFTAGLRPQAILLALLVALHPQLLFISTGVTNDVLAHLAGGFAALFVYLVLGNRISADRPIILMGGILAGGFVWTKATLYPLLPVIFLVPVLKVCITSPRRALIRFAGMLAIAAAISAPLFLRNLALYHDLLGRQELINPAAYAWNLAPKTLFDPYFAPGGAFLGLLWLSSVGVFGMMDVLMPPRYYAAWLIFVRICAAGLVLRCAADLLRRLTQSKTGPSAVSSVVSAFQSAFPTPSAPRDAAAGSLSTAPHSHLAAALFGATLSVAGVVVYNLSVTQPQGRYLFPAAIFWATCLVAGLEVWIGLCPQRYRQRIWLYLPAIAAVALILANVGSWYAALLPTYAR